MFAEHREEGGEEGSGEARINHGLDLGDLVWGAGPLGNSGSVATEGSVVNLMDKNSEEGGSLLTRVGLELRLDVDDECGGDGGEQTSLLPVLARARWNFTQNLRRSELYLNLRRTSS